MKPEAVLEGHIGERCRVQVRFAHSFPQSKSLRSAACTSQGLRERVLLERASPPRCLFWHSFLQIHAGVCTAKGYMTGVHEPPCPREASTCPARPNASLALHAQSETSANSTVKGLFLFFPFLLSKLASIATSWPTTCRQEIHFRGQVTLTLVFISSLLPVGSPSIPL